MSPAKRWIGWCNRNWHDGNFDGFHLHFAIPMLRKYGGLRYRIGQRYDRRLFASFLKPGFAFFGRRDGITVFVKWSGKLYDSLGIRDMTA
jgi:hypothetical protein